MLLNKKSIIKGLRDPVVLFSQKVFRKSSSSVPHCTDCVAFSYLGVEQGWGTGKAQRATMIA